jgi:hypothetical protein
MMAGYQASRLLGILQGQDRHLLSGRQRGSTLSRRGAGALRSPPQSSRLVTVGPELPQAITHFEHIEHRRTVGLGVRADPPFGFRYVR